MFTVRAADTGFFPARMEALHGFEVFAVDVGFAELQAAGDVEGFVQVGGVHGAGQTEFAVVCQGIVLGAMPTGASEEEDVGLRPK